MKHRGIDWNNQPLGELSDRAIADDLGVSYQAVWQARSDRGIAIHRERIDWDQQAGLGSSPDLVLAERLGVHVSSVCHARLRRGIPHKGVRSTDWAAAGIGEMSDAFVAGITGRSPSSVAYVRKRLGIPPFEADRECSCGRSFLAGKKTDRFCSERCRKAADASRQKYRHLGDLDPVFVALARFNREIKERRA